MYRNGDSIFHSVTVDEWSRAGEEKIPAWICASKKAKRVHTRKRLVNRNFWY